MPDVGRLVVGTAAVGWWRVIVVTVTVSARRFVGLAAVIGGDWPVIVAVGWWRVVVRVAVG
jgi:hypothetical protein